MNIHLLILHSHIEWNGIWITHFQKASFSQKVYTIEDLIFPSQKNHENPFALFEVPFQIVLQKIENQLIQPFGWIAVGDVPGSMVLPFQRVKPVEQVVADAQVSDLLGMEKG